MSPLSVWIALSIVNTYYEFEVNIFSNNRDIKKCLKFLQDNDDGKAIAVPWVFSENSRAKTAGYVLGKDCCNSGLYGKGTGDNAIYF